MATVMNTLYPPVVQTYMPAFPYEEAATLCFAASSFNDIKDVKKIHLSLVDQKTNENSLVHSIIIYEADESLIFDDSSGIYYLKITQDMLKNNNKSFIPDQYYKAQIRFDVNEDNMDICFVNANDGYGEYNSNENYSDNLNEYLVSNTQYFTEWSTVCLLRPIHPCKLKITTFPEESGYTNKKDDVEVSSTFSYGEMIVSGELIFYENSSYTNILNGGKENLNNYSIIIWEKSNDNEYKNIFETEVIYPEKQGSLANNQIYKNLFLPNFINKDDVYWMELKAVTNNGYIIENRFFPLSVYCRDDGPTIDAEFFKDEENGRLKINIKVERGEDSDSDKFYDYDGKLIVRRTDDSSNFKNWETLRIFSLDKEKWGTEENKENPKFYLIDNTVGSMNWYKYSFQFIDSNNMGRKIFESKKIYFDFEYAIFSRGLTQLKIAYDFDISNYKPIVSRAKIDTLGGKYPKFAENAVLGYRQFSISGKISSEEDERQLFITKNHPDEKTTYDDNDFKIREPYNKDDYLNRFNDETYEEYYKENEEEKHVGRLKEEQESNDCYENHGNFFKHSDWLWERKFRESVIKWLNDGNPKLMRTLTEGNICVMLTDINLTPEKTLFRRLYNFTATAYEIGNGYDIKTLDNLGIYNIQDETSLEYKEANNLPLKKETGEELSKIIRLNNFNFNTYNGISTKDKDIVNYLQLYTSLKISGNEKPSIMSNSFNISDVIVQFYGEPHLFIKDSSGNTKPLKESEIEDNKDKIFFIGYRMKVKFDGNKEEQEILVNKNGYYQFPSGTNITYLSFPEMDYKNLRSIDKIDITSYIHCRVYNKQSTIASGIKIIKPILVGQIHEIFQDGNNGLYESSVRYLIDKKYSSTIYYDYGTIKYKEALEEYLDGIMIETDPYTIISISTKNENEPVVKEFIVGQSGVLNLLNKGLKIKDIKLLGRKMVNLGNESNAIDPPATILLEENESIAANKKLNNHYWNDKIYWNGKEYDYDENTNIAKIPVHMIVTYQGKLVRKYY